MIPTKDNCFSVVIQRITPGIKVYRINKGKSLRKFKYAPDSTMPFPSWETSYRDVPGYVEGYYSTYFGAN
jgi:hypothetical protein